MKIGFIGLGKLGLPVSLAIDMRGHDILGYDVNPNIRSDKHVTEILKTKEKGVDNLSIEEIMNNSKLKFADSLEDVIKHGEIIFVAVQTPHNPKYEGITKIPDDRKDFNYEWLINSIKEISKIVNKIDENKIVIIISTVLPGTINKHIIPILSKKISLCYNPFFIAMGTTIEDFLYPEFILFGVSNIEAYNKAVEFYKTLNNAPIYKTTIENAELIKVSYNTMISTKILFANLLMEMCDKLPNTNVDEVTNALKLSNKRLISTAYLSGGMGDGGGCHPRDNIAMSWLSNKLNLSINFFDNIMIGREKQTEYLADLCINKLHKYNLKDIVILGKAFKPETNLIDGSPSILLKNLLIEKGYNIEMYDPYIDKKNRMEYLDNKKLYFIGTKHEIFTTYKFPKESYIIDPHRYIPLSDNYRVYYVGVYQSNT